MLRKFVPFLIMAALFLKIPIYGDSFFFEDPFFLSPYSWGNPAYLIEERTPELLKFQSLYYNEKGDYHSFLMPKSNSIFKQSVSGKKEVKNKQFFKGDFAYIRHELKHTLMTKDIPFGMPFLLGDDEMGKQEYDGLLLNGEFCSPSYVKNMNWGFQIDYYVDDGVKDDFPHPTANHNLLNVNLGIDYHFNSLFHLGIFSGFYQGNEEISYREDKSKAKVPIIQKYNHFSFPEEYEKNTETRILDENGFRLNFTLRYPFLQGTSLTAFTWTNSNKKFKDNGSDPYQAGDWENNHFLFSHGAVYDFKNLRFRVQSDYQYENPVSRHPLYQLTIADIQNWKHSPYLVISLNQFEKILPVFSGGCSWEGMDFYDGQGQSHWKNNYFIYFFKPEFRMEWNRFLYSIDCSYQYKTYDKKMLERYNTQEDFGKMNELWDFYFCDTEMFRVSGMMVLKTENKGFYSLKIIYEREKVKDQWNKEFIGKTRNQFYAVLDIYFDLYSFTKEGSQ